MKSKLLFLTLITVLTSVIVSVPALAQSQAPIKLTFSNYLPVPFYATSVLGEFCEEIKKRTSGRVQIAYYPGGTLTTGPNVYDGIVNQRSDLGVSHIGYTRGRFPVTEMLDLPVGYTSGFVCAHVKHDFYKKFKPEEWNDVHVLYFWSPGPLIFATSKKPLKTMADLKGMKFRAVGRPADTIKALGAIPVALEMGDVYDGVKRGLLDGIFEGMETWKGFRVGDVVKYGYFTQRGTGLMYTFYVAMNKEKWNGLPDDIKKTFAETSEDWVDKIAMKTLEADFAGLDYLKQCGVQMTTLPDEEIQKMQEAVKPVMQKYMKDMEGKGFKRAEMEAQLQFIRERIAYWSKHEKDRNLKSPWMQ